MLVKGGLWPYSVGFGDPGNITGGSLFMMIQKHDHIQTIRGMAMYTRLR